MAGLCTACGSVVAEGSDTCTCGAPFGVRRGSATVRIAPRLTRFDHARVADDAVRKLKNVGIPLDFSPASLGALDAFLDRTVGERGAAPEAADWVPDAASHTLILLYGSYAGEVARRRLGGAWADDPNDPADVLRVRLVLSETETALPLEWLWDRLKNGALRGVLSSFDRLRERLPVAPDHPSEAPRWVTFGGLLLAAQPEAAFRLFERAVRLDGACDGALAGLEEARAALQAPGSQARPASAPPPTQPSAAPPPVVLPSPVLPSTSPPPPGPSPLPVLVLPSEPPQASTAERLATTTPPPPPSMVTIQPSPMLVPAPPSMRAPSMRAPSTHSSGPPGIAVTTSRAFESAADLAGDLCALAIAKDIEAIDETLTAGEPFVGPGLSDGLIAWVEESVRSGDPETVGDACEGVILIASRLTACTLAPDERFQMTARVLLEKSARAFGPSLSVERRAAIIRALALCYSDGAPLGPTHLHDDAVALIEGLLRVVDARAHPMPWASLQHALGIVSARRTTGNRRDHVETAIGALGRALRVYTGKEHRTEHGETQLALGQALRMRTTGEKQKSIEEALSAFRAAVAALPEGTMARGLGDQGIGLCLLSSISGDRARNVEDGIAALVASLATLPEASAEAAKSHYNIGLAYQRRKVGARAENLSRAAEHYRLGMHGLEHSGTGERQSLQENLAAAEHEIHKLS